MFNLKYLSKNFIKFNIQGVFWNPQDEQISKLTLVIKFDQDLMEKKRKTSWLILTDTGCMSKKCQHGEVLVLISQQGPEILSSLHFVPY